MKFKAMITLIGITSFSIINSNAQNNNLADSVYRQVQISFLPFIGTEGLSSSQVACHVSLNILAGSIRQVDGLEMGGLVNHVRDNAGKCQLAGIGNVVGKEVSGVQGAGVFNQVDGMHGVQMAGVVNNTRVIDGTQLSGVLNNATQGHGVQLSGLLNNTSKGKSIQIAGLMNNADSTGLQMAGLMNRANDVKGLQMAGLVNVARRVKGTQIGIINIADSCGTPIGLINIVKNGLHQLEVYGDELFYANVAFRSGTVKLHTQLTAGIRPDQFDAPLWTYGWGIGTSRYLAPKTSLDIDALFSHVVKKTDFGNNYLYKAAVSVDQKIGKRTSLVFGLTYNVLSVNTRSAAYNETYANMVPYHFTNHTYGKYNVKSWLGAKIGFRFF